MNRRTENQNETSQPHSEFDIELWEQLERFSLDVPENGLTFTQRLARDNAWTLSYARRVTDEYRRFVYLAKKAGQIVCPSDAVDQVWHMHLTYTHSYWDELCSEVLDTPLHHGPTKGGSHEREKFYRLYEKTLESYHLHFGEFPPEDIWPPAETRFGSDLHYVRINAAENFIIPKPTWRGTRRASLGLAAVGGLFPLAQIVANPLEWSGPNFLLLYFSVLVAAVFICLIARIVTRSNDGEVSAGSDPTVGPIEAAWLKGGDTLSVTAALVDLAQAEAVEVKGPLVQAGPRIAQANPEHRVEKLILQAVSNSPLGCSWRTVRRDANPGLQQMRQELEDKGLVVSATQAGAARALPILLFGSILFAGLLKIGVGLSRGRPVGFLLLGELAAVAALALFLCSVPRLTAAGKRLLARLTADAEHKHKGGVWPVDGEGKQQQHDGLLGDSTLVWSTALLGTAVLADSSLSPLHSFVDTNVGGNRSAASGGCSTGCGGDAGCGGGGGCGGGCGGCGG
ncbi:MAG: TIGR04222 domain-containing membrane protein [Aureliella sp.]